MGKVKILKPADPEKLRKYYKSSAYRNKIRQGKKPTYKSVKFISKDYCSWKKTEDYSKWKKNQVLKQGGLCWYCGVWLNFCRTNVEHIKPRSKGGTNHKSNLVISCASCNKKKGSTEISKDKIDHLRKINKKRKGTYLKNKKYFERLYAQPDLSWI